MNRYFLILPFFCLICAGLCPCSLSAEDRLSGHHHATSQTNMVATVDSHATQAAIAAMEDGGNAVDAAVAAALTLGVVDGYNSGIGGGCFILIRSADGKITAIDGRETAPAAAHRDFYRDAFGKLQPLASRNGPRAVGVPGALLALEEALKLHGKKSLSELILPAAKIADDGFEVSETLSKRITGEYEQITLFPATAKLLLKEDAVPLQAGDIFYQKDLANTYRSVAKHGTDWFYKGPFAERVAQWMKENGGALTQEDFAQYKTVLREPIRSSYRDHEIIGFPPPSSGGIHVAQILNILEHFDLAAVERTNRIQAKHLIAEAMKLAFADRAFWPGDPKFVDVPKGLISKKYACQLSGRINPLFQSEVLSHGLPPNPTDIFRDRHTTHIAVADKQGNWVAITSTLNTWFGSKVVVPGTGVILNNEMDDFAIAPGVPNAFDLIGANQNAISAGKRPLSSMSPTIVLKEGQPVLTLGAAGGPKIITQVVCALINVIDFGMPADKAIAQPRFHHQWSPNRLRVEETMSVRDQSELRSYGHELQLATFDDVGITQIISFDPKTGTFTGAHDPRIKGLAKGSSKAVPSDENVARQGEPVPAGSLPHGASE